MKVLVCGGRNLRNDQKVHSTLDLLKGNISVDEVIHGGARGVDASAGRWAFKNRIKQTIYHADWNEHGDAAGPIRNSEMIAAKPDLVVAFPGGKGTADTVSKARNAGITVWEVP